jgi:hypothetical protein
MVAKYSTSTVFEERLKKVENELSEEDWFSAFSNTVTYFEYYGYWKVRNRCTSKGIRLSNKEEGSLKRLGVANLALFLRMLDLIDSNDFAIIKNTIAERNKIVHPNQEGIRYLDTKEKKEEEQLLKSAIKCLRDFWAKKTER